MLDENNLASNSFISFESHEENLRTMRLNVLNDNTLDSKQKIIKSFEIEYDYLENQIKVLIYSNDEMSKYDLNDEIIMESRSENLKFMQKYLIRINKIKSEIAKLDPTHHLLENKEIFIGDTFEKKFHDAIENINYMDIDEIKDKDNDKELDQINKNRLYDNEIIDEINL